FTVIKKGLTEVSIRAPRSHAGRRMHRRHATRKGRVSIRAPRSHAGRHFLLGPVWITRKFQSAPRVRTRGDGTTTTTNVPISKVSIRAPRSHAGRPRWLAHSLR